MPSKSKQIKRVLTDEFQVADYSNHAFVAGTPEEVVVTFFQIVTPTEDSDNASDTITALPVARVALPRNVAKSLSELLAKA